VGRRHTYIHTWAGFIYLATVIDCYSKKVVGWSIADHMRTELVENALNNAAATTVIKPCAVFHSDSKYVRCQVFPGFVTLTPIDSRGYRGVGGVLAAS
jgi:hypothetical protein